ncbi:MAG: hypothetical protein ACPGJM_13055, partial [Paracoccaceae bacterium]
LQAAEAQAASGADEASEAPQHAQQSEAVEASMETLNVPEETVSELKASSTASDETNVEPKPKKRGWWSRGS